MRLCWVLWLVWMAKGDSFRVIPPRKPHGRDNRRGHGEDGGDGGRNRGHGHADDGEQRRRNNAVGFYMTLLRDWPLATTVPAEHTVHLRHTLNGSKI